MLVTYWPAWAANAQLQLIAEDAAAAEFNMSNLFMDDDAGVFEIYSAPDEWLAHETDERLLAPRALARQGAGSARGLVALVLN